MPTSSLPFITNTPLRSLPISTDASRTVDCVPTLTTRSLPMILRSVGTDPPNICSIIACIAASCALFVLRAPPAARFIACDTASDTASLSDLPSCTFSRIDIAS